MKKAGQNAPVIDPEFAKTCSTKCFHAARALAPAVVTNYIGSEEMFPIINQALPHAQTVADRNAIINFLQAIEKAVRSSSEDHMKFLILDSLYAADPGLFFDFCHKPPLNRSQARKLFKSLYRTLNRSMPNRKTEIIQVCQYVVRRLMGDATARTLLLWGPPGAGKSELATQVVKALSVAGIEAKGIFQVMTQESSPYQVNEGGMRLLGTSRRWSNGTPGDLYNQISSPHVDLGLVLLDEADKTQQRDFLVGLLDPKTPLQDQYIREVIPTVTLRHKSLMLLTANDPHKLNQGDADPLWSRLNPVYLRSYTQKEMIDITVNYLSGDPQNPYQSTSTVIRKLAAETLRQLGDKASLRVVLDQVNDKVFYTTLGLERPIDGEHVSAVTKRKPIGFQV